MYGGPLFSPTIPSTHLPFPPHFPVPHTFSSSPSISSLPITSYYSTCTLLDVTTLSPSPLTSLSLPLLLSLSPPQPPERKLRGLRDQPRVTRFDEPLPETRKVGEEDTSPTPPFSLSQDTSSRWKMLAGRLSEAVVKVRSEE